MYDLKVQLLSDSHFIVTMYWNIYAINLSLFSFINPHMSIYKPEKS